MAFRASVNTAYRIAGVIAVGGDVPPELTGAELQRLSAALIVRGRSDDLYTEKQFADDEQRLRQSSAQVRAVGFDTGHEWPGGIAEVASRFLSELHS